jgi:hypothetical protein
MKLLYCITLFVIVAFQMYAARHTELMVVNNNLLGAQSCSWRLRKASTTTGLLPLSVMSVILFYIMV